ncbi:peptidoglycan-binding protein LysM [Azoarcus sp. L1K30]|uniref:peptidoglycan-binding protein LysM n=1 Tax=Azoarcus sp. L1K30 TaxID=2820277 RepID=UPI001B83617B|nr:peptidoglycan-binding protein LysM [Azoarcus sp. L1K30]MBR0566751.1 peptidoglycan-binding protein LysM [Azoarcus sp. L1K30]
MGLFSFIKDAGEKLFGTGEAKAAQDAAAAAPSPEANARANTKAAEAIAHYLDTLKLLTPDITISFDGASAKVTVSGTTPDQATKERVLLAAGNVAGVAEVEDKVTVLKPEPEGRFHTVVRGDTLSAIAKTYYGNANKYMVIFEANKPMLGHPDKIYPGQMLRIPPQA